MRAARAEERTLHFSPWIQWGRLDSLHHFLLMRYPTHLIPFFASEAPCDLALHVAHADKRPGNTACHRVNVDAMLRGESPRAIGDGHHSRLLPRFPCVVNFGESKKATRRVPVRTGQNGPIRTGQATRSERGVVKGTRRDNCTAHRHSAHTLHKHRATHPASYCTLLTSLLTFRGSRWLRAAASRCGGGPLPRRAQLQHQGRAVEEPEPAGHLDATAPGLAQMRVLVPAPRRHRAQPRLRHACVCLSVRAMRGRRPDIIAARRLPANTHPSL